MKAIILGFLLFGSLASCSKQTSVNCVKCSSIDSVIIYDNKADSTISEDFTIKSSFDTCGISETGIKKLEYYGSRNVSVSSVGKNLSKKTKTVLICH